MSSALKPALPPAGAQPSPGKPVPGGAAPPLVGQNLVHHQAAPAHSALNSAHVPMSPVSQNMAQMAQNMSHHGNLSHVNNGAPPVGASNGAPQPSKAAVGAPLSLVQDKCPTTVSRPLALTRPTDKKDEDTSARANGMVESSNLPTDVQDTENAKSEASVPAKTPAEPTEASTAKPKENSPAKADRSATLPNDKTPATPAPESSADNQLQVNKLGSSTDVADKTSPAKPKECKESLREPAVAPTSTEQKTPDESASAKISNIQPAPPTEIKSNADLKPAEIGTPQKAEAKIESDTPTDSKTESKIPTAPVDQPQPASIPAKKDPSPQKKEEVRSEESKETVEVSSTPVAKKVEPKTPATKSTLKLATVTPPIRKRRPESLPKPESLSAKASAEGDDSSESRASKRSRTKVQPYQSPTAELAMVTKLSASTTPAKPNDDKLIVFYKNEYLAVRNAEGGFYVCQTMQNVYRSSRKIKIRWLSQDKTLDPSGDTYKPDFYDTTDMECVLTTLSLTRSSAGGGAQVLNSAEASRARSILERAISAETGKPPNMQLTEEHPDGLDLSLYTDESQLEKKKKGSRKRKSDTDKSDDETTEKEDDTKTPSKRAKAPRKSPQSTPKAEKTPSAPKSEPKRKSGGISGGNKTALSESVTPAKSPAAKKAKATPVKKTLTRAAAEAAPARNTPKAKSARKSEKELKMEQLAATPSTSTGKTTRTGRNPPATK